MYKQLRIDEIRAARKNKKKEEENKEKIEKRVPQHWDVWLNFMRDQDTLDEIQKDIRRTRSELQYFIEGIVPGNRGMGAAKRYMQSSNCTFEEVIDYVRNV